MGEQQLSRGYRSRSDLLRPEWHSFDDSTNGDRARLAGAEFQTNQHGPLLDLYNTDALCAVCLVPRATALMIPAKMTCPSGWTREYSGYLMTEKYTHHRADFICVDEGAEGESGTEANDNGALIYHVEGRCNYNMHCPPYVNGRELTCVVCSANPK
ncbi:hypothetical protein Bbelb_005120 [Branchiostoma belcheri]|nr:hypothetical protein Bbelb_005120 [Branchiostoma belcheri]